MTNCLNCNKSVKRSISKFCSNQCQTDHQYNEYIKLWKQGLRNGERGLVAKNISAHLKRYLVNKFGDSCSICHWDKINPLTNKVPLEIDHLNGNSADNSEENLRLICPNCHSLSSNFRNLNKGKGRGWRLKYLRH